MSIRKAKKVKYDSYVIVKRDLSWWGWVTIYKGIYIRRYSERQLPVAWFQQDR